MVADFYRRFSALIIYYCSLSSFSIRHPVSVSKRAYYKDFTHERRVVRSATGIEEDGKEYEQLGSYFVYRRYSNIHKFFESYQYHRAERKYNGMAQLDISKCFDSIYTHSIVWAVLGKSQAKFKLDQSKATFAGKFDGLMQLLNERETNGIVIGPEFSRVFAEIILQSTDVELERRLLVESGLKNKRDYEIFRYVDDYFVFYNDPSTAQRVSELARVILSEVKLHLNDGKMKVYEKPIITEITIGKDLISALLNEEIRDFSEQGSDEIGSSAEKRAESLEPLMGEEADTSPIEEPLLVPPPHQFDYRVAPSRLIVKYKTALRQSGTSYGDVLNYTFAIIENKMRRLALSYLKSDRSHKSQRILAKTIAGVAEFMFFAYAASPRVNHTVRLVRTINGIVDLLNNNQIGTELKHYVYKFVNDRIVQQLEKNRVEKYREVETLYLLNGLSLLGREYWLSEDVLAGYFGLKFLNGNYARDSFLNHFSITVGLSYIREKRRYSKIRSFFEAHAIEKLEHIKANCPNDAESVMLFLDLLVCPFVSAATKDALCQIYGFPPGSAPALEGINSHWFTTWSKLDLGKELDAKRSREVY